MFQGSENKEGKLFTIIHFNDVYDIQPHHSGTRGIVNFEAYVRELRQLHPESLLLFSGDAFSPSILTNIYDGQQMVYALNKLKIDASCFGNHEFDLEMEKTEELVKQSNFPWLLGNIRYIDTEFILGNGIPYIVKEVNNKKIGIFGLGGQDWLGILGDDYENQLQYDDIVAHSKKMCKILKNEKNCDMIIALTHMRVPQDQLLPKEVSEIDIILGGHDHIIMKEFINNIPVLKCGDNFKNIGVIEVFQKGVKEAQWKGNNFDFQIDIKPVPIAPPEAIDKQIKQYVDKCMHEYSKHDRIVGYTDVELNTKFQQIRTQQTNYGNFVADLTRYYYDVDCAIINSGSIRNDAYIKPGKITYSMVSNIINNPLIVKQLSGSSIFEALEYGCSGCPSNYLGSFLLVSGIQYHYDYRQNPRVKFVSVRGTPLELDKKYTVATTMYMGGGGDGFEMLKDSKVLVDETMGIQTLNLILKFFKGENLISQQNNAEIDEQYHVDEEEVDVPDFPLQILKLGRKLSVKLDRISKLRKRFVVGPTGKRFISIAPVVDGRIKSLYP